MTTDLIRQALDAAGYHHEPDTEEALKGCFLDGRPAIITERLGTRPRMPAGRIKRPPLNLRGQEYREKG